MVDSYPIDRKPPRGASFFLPKNLEKEDAMNPVLILLETLPLGWIVEYNDGVDKALVTVEMLRYASDRAIAITHARHLLDNGKFPCLVRLLPMD
jgi:hypothetical protein